MRSAIQDLIGIVLLIGALFVALKSTAKKGADLYRYLVKISKEIKTLPKRQPAISSTPKQRRTFANMFGSQWLLLVGLVIFQIGLLAWKIAQPTPLTKIEVMRISMDVAVLMILVTLFLLNYFADRIIKVVDQIVDVIGRLMAVVDVLVANASADGK